MAGKSRKAPPDLERLMRKQRKLFIKKFGREPTDADPVFFDPEAEAPKPLFEAPDFDAMMAGAMREAGTDPLLIYVYQKTGFILNEQGYKNLSKKDRAEYDAVVEEYYAMERSAAKKPKH
jgi:hypothetical protein